MFFSAQIYFPVHKYIFQCKNLFFSAQIYFQCTNIFFSAQIYFPVHKYIFQSTNLFSSAQIYFQCTNIFSVAQICNWRPGCHCLPAPNWLPFCTTKTMTTRPEGLLNSTLESMFCTFCGAQVQISFAFCPTCGGSLRNDRQASVDRGGSTCWENVLQL